MIPLTGDSLTLLLGKMYENSIEAIFFIDRDGKVLAMNPAAENILDTDVIERMYRNEENSLCQSCQGYMSEQEAISCCNCYLVSPKEDFSSFQVYLKTRNQGIVPYAASYHLIDETSGTRIFMLLNLTKQFQTQEKLYQSKMLKYIIKAQEDERKRISRELHDSVAQELLSSLVDLRVIKYMNVNEDVLRKIQQTEISITRLLDDIRHLSVELRPASLDDLGLEAAFRSHFKGIEKNYGVLIDFSAELSAARYSNEIETVVYRVCQEAVLNALKYADTDQVYVKLFEQNGYLQLIVRDEGVGFILDSGEVKGTGLGLYGMRERSELVNGQLTLTSDIGKGTTIQLYIPLAEVRIEEEALQ
ncbi:PAS domain-containing sensor histidine kinase [Paenibacillus wynnii]|uniref:PAS domain-containing sensor histidine kinase n=1 Tax=Paenibacillus wynnii TaxID=268407 RepID=UPI00279372C7|nr:ATP-binding protein [Paenibacillus wynnii]MDQ0194780.1 two-component system sensor histidine kinase NreB [Paenibacillus wynnii]